MRVFSYNDKQTKINSSVLILGAFDSIHNGHIELIKQAKTFNLPISLTLFKDVNLIPSKRIKWLYSSNQIKLEHLASLKIENIVVVSFEEIKTLDGDVFINHLIKLTNARHIVVGHNFAYGKNRQYDAKHLQQFFPATTIINDYKVDNQKVSTSLLKQFVTLGEVAEILHFSPFPYTVESNLTFNFITQEFNLTGGFKHLHSGIYAVFIIINQIRYAATLAHWGLETKVIILDFIVDKTYEWQVKVSLISQIRTIIKAQDQILNEQDLIISQTKLKAYLIRN